MVNSFSSSVSLFFLLGCLQLLLMITSTNSVHYPLKSLHYNNGQCMAYRPARETGGRDVAHRRMKRLSGGAVGNIREMPWLIYIQISFISIFSNALQTYPCTGSLVSHRHVLTSAHCIPLPRNRLNGTGMNITVFYGAANHSEGHQIPIDWETNFQVHPNFTLGLRTNNTFGNGTDSYVINDLAIIDLGRKLEFSASVHSICVACLEPNRIYSKGTAIVAGWGNINTRCNDPTQTINSPDIFNYNNNVGIHKCLSPGFLVGDKVCMDADDTHSIGGGDSGGPLLASDNNGSSFIQMGVTGYNDCRSYQRENAAAKIPKEWFEEVTGVKCKKFHANN